MDTTIVLEYAILDVFTITPFKGNQLAVVHIPTSTQLTQSTKQVIAREFNFSETVFLHEADLETLDRRLDIFTINAELPFAGHPVIGAICHVCQTSNPSLGAVTLKTKAGDLVGRYSEGTGLAEAEIPHQVRVHRAKVPAKALLASQSGVSSRVVLGSAYPVVSIVKGMTFILTRMEDLKALGRLQAAAQRVEREEVELDDGWEPSFVALYYYVVLQRTNQVTKIRSRMMEPSIGEDSCTGSAASSLAAYLSLQDGGEGRTYAYIIEQGVEMGRAGDIHVKVTLDDTGKAVRKMALAGSAVLVMKGTLHLPQA